jgi:tetratricopeptide (TPR) repeat protein
MYLYRNQAEFRDVIGTRQILGVYRSTLDGGRAATVGAIQIDPRNLGGRQVVLHEFAHHYLAQLSPLNYPIWYVEGFADLLSTIVYKRNEVRIGTPLAPRIAPLNDRKSWVDLRTLLNAKDPDIGKTGDWLGLDRFYGQSWLLAHMVQLHPELQSGRDAFLENISIGMDPEEAIELSFSMSFKQFESLYTNYWKGGRLPFVELAAQPYSEPIITIRTLSDDQSKAIHWRAQLDFAETRDRYAELILDIHDLLLKGDNPELRLVLAEALLSFERPDRAGKQINKVLAIKPNLTEAKFLNERINIDIATRRLEGLGEKSIANYDFKAIKDNLQKLIKKDPKNAHILYMIGLAYFLDPASDKDQSIPYLSQALALLPQNNEIRLMLAKALEKEKNLVAICHHLKHIQTYAKHEKIKAAAIKELGILASQSYNCM